MYWSQHPILIFFAFHHGQGVNEADKFLSCLAKLTASLSRISIVICYLYLIVLNLNILSSHWPYSSFKKILPNLNSLELTCDVSLATGNTSIFLKAVLFIFSNKLHLPIPWYLFRVTFRFVETTLNRKMNQQYGNQPVVTKVPKLRAKDAKVSLKLQHIYVLIAWVDCHMT